MLNVSPSGPGVCSNFWSLFWWMLFCGPLARTDLVKKWTSLERNNMLIAKKHKRIFSREIQFWTRIWSGRGDSLKDGTEAWDDGNTSNGDGCKTLGPNGETSNCFVALFN